MMKPSLIAALLAPLAFAACASSPAPVLTPVSPVVQTPSPAPGVAARAACETAATPLVRRQIRGANEVTYSEPQLRVVSPTATSVRGSGQVTRPNGTSNFAYSCTFNQRTGATSAVRVTRR